MRRRVRESLAAFRRAFGNPDLRRIQLAWIGASLGAWSYGVALAVYAFREDGVFAVGLIGLIRWLVAAAAAPLMALLGDRVHRGIVMSGANLLRGLTMLAMAAVAAAGGPSLIVYALAVVISVATVAFRPAQAAILPSLSRTPEELTSANVAASAIEAIGVFAGPALGGLLLAAASAEAVFTATGVLFVAAGLVIVPLARQPVEARKPVRGRFLPELAAGFATIWRDSRLRLVIGLLASQAFVAGMNGVLIVVLALEVLETGSSGVGFLYTVVGVGGIVGGVVAAALIGRGRVARNLGVGLVLWGAPIALIGLWPTTPTALLLYPLVGLGNTVVDVAVDTVLQRTVPDDVLARVFGASRSLVLAMIGTGAMVAPILVSALDARGAMIVAGAFLPLLAVVVWRRLVRLDAAAPAPAERLALLQRIPMLAALPPQVLEGLAARLEPLRIAPGQVVFSEGDRGDRFYVIERGTAEVAVPGATPVRLAADDFFGEIALLRDVPRTATVRAVDELALYALARDDFVGAVTGHAESAEAAGAVVSARLEGPRLGAATA